MIRPPGTPPALLAGRPRGRRRQSAAVAPNCDHTDALLVAAGRGDLHAFAAFYDLTAPVVFGMLHGALGDSGRAERATEDVYVRLWRDAAVFDARGCSAWAMVMAEAHRALTGRLDGLVTTVRPGPPAPEAPHEPAPR